MPPSPERAAPKASEPAQDSGQLEDLNEGQLKALLDEAVNYKRPKDREGKSNLFKNLLHEAEQDEYLHGRTSICGTSSGGAGGKRGRVKRSLATFPHSGSLQDLAGAGTGPDTRVPRPQTRHRRTVPVSQRSYHGGSLPANVDQQNFGVTENRHSFLEDVRYGSGVGNQISGGDYIATVRCVNPPPLGSDSSSDHMVLRVAANENERVPSPPTHSIVNSPQSTYSTAAGYYDDDGTEMELLSSLKIPHIPSYTTRKTLEIGSSSMTGDSAIDRGIAFSLVDTNHGCISSPVVCQSQAASVLENKPLQLASTYNAVRSVTDSGPGSNITPAFPVSNVISFLHPQTHQFIDSDKKSFDENYNSVQNSVGGQHVKKTKRKKLVKKETAILAELIEGHLGHIDNIDFLVEFIESGVENIAQSGKYQSKSTSDVGINGKVSSSQDKKYDNYDKANKKRSTERRTKDGKIDSKIKRANSMEELSHRKLDDLTTNSTKDTSSLRKSKKSSGVHSESNAKSNERRSWCNDDYTESYFKNNDNKNNDTEVMSSLESTAASSLIVKNNKKTKLLETDNLDCDSFYNIETSDFQTVTKKKKIRKKHSSGDDNQNRHNNSGNNNLHGCKIGFSGRSMHERDTIYKRLGHGSRPSASSPPSDKSNDSNDDLDSVHSLPADASGERLQASYADMARAAPPASPPPPPPPANIARQRNFPDLIESCNYYSNDILTQEENTKNLLLKNSALLDSDKNKVIKMNSFDADHNIHKAYSREQYPALETRQKSDKVKSKVDNKTQNKSVNQTSDKKIKVTLNKCHKDEAYPENCSVSSFEDINSNEYVNFSKINIVNVNESFKPKVNKYHSGKIDGLINKPPDVVLPIAEMTHSIDRPAVIIMNEELNRNSDNVYNIDGITFGFDINEQLINGDSGCIMEDSSNAIDISACANGLDSSDLANSLNMVYNSTIDFPAINEKPFREYNDKAKNNEDFKHSKKSNRAPSKDAAKFNNKNNDELHDSKSNEPTCNGNKEEEVQGVAVVEARIGRDKALRYIAPTTTSKDIYNLDKIVHYVGMAWEDIIKSSGDKVCYFSEKQ